MTYLEVLCRKHDIADLCKEHQRHRHVYEWRCLFWKYYLVIVILRRLDDLALITGG